MRKESDTKFYKVQIGTKINDLKWEWRDHLSADGKNIGSCYLESTRIPAGRNRKGEPIFIDYAGAQELCRLVAKETGRHTRFVTVSIHRVNLKIKSSSSVDPELRPADFIEQ